MQGAVAQNRTELAAHRAVDRREHRAVLGGAGGSPCGRRAVGLGVSIESKGSAGSREQDGARCICDLERCGRRACARRASHGAGEHGASWGAVCLGDLVELFRNHGPQTSVVAENEQQCLDLGLQLISLTLELDARELRQAAQSQFEDVLGLRLAQVEHLHQSAARRFGVITRANELNHLIDVEDRDEQALDEVQSLAPLAQSVLAAPANHREAVVDEDAQ